MQHFEGLRFSSNPLVKKLFGSFNPSLSSQPLEHTCLGAIGVNHPNGQAFKVVYLRAIDDYPQLLRARAFFLVRAEDTQSQAIVAVLEPVGTDLPPVAYLFVTRGVPEHLRSDNGSEFTAKAVRDWLRRVGVKTLYIEPGSPW